MAKEQQSDEQVAERFQRKLQKQEDNPKKVDGPAKEVANDEKFSLIRYTQNAYKEFKKVTWPTRDEAIRSTLVVIAFSIFVAAFLGILDYGFNEGLNYLIDLKTLN